MWLKVGASCLKIAGAVPNFGSSGARLTGLVRTITPFRSLDSKPEMPIQTFYGV